MTVMLANTWYEFLWQYEFAGNVIWQWLALLATVLASFIVGKTLSLLLLRQAHRCDAIEGRFLASCVLLRSAARPLTLLAVSLGLYFAATFMDLTFTFTTKSEDGASEEVLNLQDDWEMLCWTLIVLAVAWFIYGLVDLVEMLMTRVTRRTETTLDDQLVPLLRKALRVVVVIMAALFLAQNVYHWDIGALVAGLGLGGLAFALAAKDMLANLFGSVTIFADRPFTLGERVNIEGYDGLVEEVGFRSTRIRLLNGNLVTIPNGTVANSPVENIGRRPSIKRVLDVTVTYDTPPEKLQRGVEIIREMLEKRMEHFPEDFPPRVYFSDFNAASLNIQVYYWFIPPDWWEYLEFTHQFNIELLERFNAEGIEFAFPTQTLYVKQDSPLEADIHLRDSSASNHDASGPNAAS